MPVIVSTPPGPVGPGSPGDVFSAILYYLKTEVDALIAGGLHFKGDYNAATDNPDLDTTVPTANLIGDMYTVTVAGNFFTEEVEPGDAIISRKDSPEFLTDWVVVNKNLITEQLTRLNLLDTQTATPTTLTKVPAFRQLVQPSGADITVVLPLISTVPGGWPLELKNDNATYDVVVNRNAADSGGANVTTISPGNTAVVVFDGVDYVLFTEDISIMPGTSITTLGVIHVSKGNSGATDTRAGLSNYAHDMPFLTIAAAITASDDDLLTDITTITAGAAADVVVFDTTAAHPLTLGQRIVHKGLTSIAAVLNGVKGKIIAITANTYTFQNDLIDLVPGAPTAITGTAMRHITLCIGDGVFDENIVLVNSIDIHTFVNVVLKRDATGVDVLIKNASRGIYSITGDADLEHNGNNQGILFEISQEIDLKVKLNSFINDGVIVHVPVDDANEYPMTVDMEFEDQGVCNNDDNFPGDIGYSFQLDNPNLNFKFKGDVDYTQNLTWPLGVLQGIAEFDMKLTQSAASPSSFVDLLNLGFSNTADASPGQAKCTLKGSYKFKGPASVDEALTGGGAGNFSGTGPDPTLIIDGAQMDEDTLVFISSRGTIEIINGAKIVGDDSDAVISVLGGFPDGNQTLNLKVHNSDIHNLNANGSNVLIGNIGPDQDDHNDTNTTIDFLRSTFERPNDTRAAFKATLSGPSEPNYDLDVSVNYCTSVGGKFPYLFKNSDAKLVNTILNAINYPILDGDVEFSTGFLRLDGQVEAEVDEITVDGSGVATITTKVDHNFQIDQLMEFAGLTEATLANGRTFSVISTPAADTFTVAGFRNGGVNYTPEDPGSSGRCFDPNFIIETPDQYTFYQREYEFTCDDGGAGDDPDLSVGDRDPRANTGVVDKYVDTFTPLMSISSESEIIDRSLIKDLTPVGEEIISVAMSSPGTRTPSQNAYLGKVAVKGFLVKQSSQV